MDIWFWRIL